MTIDVDGETDDVSAVDSALASARASIVDGIERNRRAALERIPQRAAHHA